MRREQIVVIGGGIAGLVAGRVLHRRGFRCTLVEPRTDPIAGGAGLMLWPSALRALVRLGLPEVQDLGAPVHESVLRDWRGRTLLRIPLGIRLGSLPRAVPRHALMELLLRDLPCPVVAQACRGMRWVGEAAGIDLADGSTLSADGVLVATGMHSSLRHAISPGSAPRDCHRNSWRGLVTFHDPRLASGVAVETLGQGCRVGLFPVGAGQVYWFVQCNRREHGERLASPGNALAARLADWPDPIPRVVAATPDEAIVETPIEEMLPSPRWHTRKALLLGDAAHGMAPDLGRGACTAIVNLLELDRQLERRASFEEAIAAFARARCWRTRLIQHASRLAGEVRQVESAWLYRARNAVWRYLPPLWLLRSVVAPLLARRFRSVGRAVV